MTRFYKVELAGKHKVTKANIDRVGEFHGRFALLLLLEDGTSRHGGEIMASWIIVALDQFSHDPNCS